MRARTRSRQELSRREHVRKEQILTQHEPAKLSESSSAVVLKHGGVFLLANEAGDVTWRRPHALGLFHRDCRFLDGYVLTVNGVAPTVLSGGHARGFETYHDLTNPELVEGDHVIPAGTVGIRRERLLRGAVLHEWIRVRNHGPRRARLSVELRFRSRFEDLFVLKGFVRGPRGRVQRPRVIGKASVELSYEGRDGVRRTTTLAFAPAPAAIDGEGARFHRVLAAGEELELAISVTPRLQRNGDGETRATARRPGATPAILRRWLERSEQLWLAASTDVRSSNPLSDRVFQRAVLDLRTLRTRLHGDHFFAAGVPWFTTLFGRDAAIVAIQTLPFGLPMACETLKLLARYQATAHDEYRDAEPGKILHELRLGELSGCRAIPQSPAYYGSVDATLLFVILLCEYVNWSADLDLARRLRPNLDAALAWIEVHGDHDGDGYLDYVGRYGGDLVNQGWKDSGNAIVRVDGSAPEPPIALCEVQAYAYRAWRQAATLLQALGDGAAAAALDARADRLRAQFERDFWADELDGYVLALEKGGVPLAVASSNMGQVLWGEIAAPDRAARVAARLMAPDMFSGWGVRTLSSREAAFNPMSYHLGSVWPHDNGLIISGLRRYGQDETALAIFDALFQAASNFRDFRMPELWCGFERREREESPVRYPVACSPQAWAAGALPHALWNLVGLRARALERRLDVHRPCLPSWLDRLELGGLRVGNATVDLRLSRGAPEAPLDVSWQVKSGELDVRRS